MKQNKKTKASSSNWTLLLGAAFLMATSSIGPGFLTQTTVFTQSLAASFGFVILVSIILDIFVQTNVWRIIAVSEKEGRKSPTSSFRDSAMSSHFSSFWAGLLSTSAISEAPVSASRFYSALHRRRVRSSAPRSRF